MNDNILEILTRIDAHAARIVELLEPKPDAAERVSVALDAEWPTGTETVAEWNARVAAIRTGRVF